MKTLSKNRDPFSRIPIPKSFYHPSQQKTLTKSQKKITLSPSKERYISPEDEMFLKGSNAFSSQTPPTREHDFGPSQFDESWPSSERPSIASTSGYDRTDNMTMTSDVKQSLFSHLDPVEEKSRTGSVLQRYVNRFRNSAPMSREERVQKGVGHDKEFWWLGNTSDPSLTPGSSSTPIEEEGKRSRQFIDRSESLAYDTTFQSLSNARKRRSQIEDDIAIQKLQDKADRILGQSESSIGSLEAGLAISSDGLPSSESSSCEEQTKPTPRSQYRTQFKNKTGRDESTRGKMHNEDIISFKTSIKRPEDDILYQWRLQRKMDLSRQGAAELIAKNTSEVQSKLKEIQQRVIIRDMSETGPRPQLSTPRFTSAPSRNNDLYTYIEVPTNSRLQEHLQEPENMPKQTSQKPFIASPTLSRKQQGGKENLEPHLHLMCDVLPCPHSRKYQEQFKDLYPASESVHRGVEATKKSVSGTDKGEVNNDRDMHENKQFTDSERHQRVSKNSTDSARVKDKGAPTHTKSSADSLNRVTSPEPQSNSKQIPRVEKSTESVVESVDFESSEMDVTDREKESLQDEESFQSPNLAPSKRIPSRSPTKSKVIHPKYSSSPSRSTPPIKSAIGQTVKDYMFTASSSVDSMTSLLSNIDEGSPDSQHTPTSNRRQTESSRRDRREPYRGSQTSTSSQQQTHSLGREHRETSQKTKSRSNQDARSSSREHRETSQTSQSRSNQDARSSRREHRETSQTSQSRTNQDACSSSREHRETSQTSQSRSGKEAQSSRPAKLRDTRRPEKVRDSTDSLARSSQNHSNLSSRDHSDVDDEDQRYSDAETEDEDETISDEEFSNDQLLRLLRQQRNDIEKKLGEIDQYLMDR